MSYEWIKDLVEVYKKQKAPGTILIKYKERPFTIISSLKVSIPECDIDDIVRDLEEGYSNIIIKVGKDLFRVKKWDKNTQTLELERVEIVNKKSSLKEWVKNLFKKPSIHNRTETVRQQPVKDWVLNLAKEAAYEMGETEEETIRKDYEKHVKSLSNFVLAEKLTELMLRDAGYPERFSEVFPKVLKEVERNRERAEKKLLSLIGPHSKLTKTASSEDGLVPGSSLEKEIQSK